MVQLTFFNNIQSINVGMYYERITGGIKALVRQQVIDVHEEEIQEIT